MIIPFTLNSEKVFVDINPGERLIHVLRQRYKLLGSKEGCHSGRCGSCMILLDNIPVPSCVVPVFMVRNAQVITIEAFSKTEDYTDILEGFANSGVSMCGFCNSGKILTAHAILQANLRPVKDEIREQFSGNLCRCTSIDDLVAGVKNAATIRRKRLNVK